MSNESSGQLQKLLTEYDTSPGRQVEVALNGLALSYRTFAVNAKDLLEDVHAFENAFPNPFLSPSAQPDLLEYCREIVRKFQNAIASGQSFLEHMHGSIRHRYRNQAFFKEFEAEYDRVIKGVAVCQFIRALRGFQLHSRSITPVFSRSLTNFSPGSPPPCQIRLATDELRANRDRWRTKTPLAVVYLDGLKRSIDVSRLVLEYAEPVSKLREWQRKREAEIHSQALHHSKKLRNEIASLDPVMRGYLTSQDFELW